MLATGLDSFPHATSSSPSSDFIAKIIATVYIYDNLWKPLKIDVMEMD